MGTKGKGSRTSTAPLWCALFLAVSAVTTACSGGGGDATGDDKYSGPPREVLQALPDIDPPLDFEADGTPLGTYSPVSDLGLDYVVDDTAIYYLTDDTKLVSYDLATGRQRLSASFGSDDDLSLPAVSDGRVFVAYLAKVRGTGTQADRYMLRVQALDAKRGKTLWTTNIAKKYSDDLEAQSGSGMQVFAADAKHIVVTASLGLDTYTAVLTAEDGKTLWEDPSFVPVAFDGQVVAGQEASAQEYGVQPEGRAVADGSRLWKLPAAVPGEEELASWGTVGGVQETDSTHQSYLAVDIDEPSAVDPPPHVLLYRVADGKLFLGLDGDIPRASDPGVCRHDGQRTIVCGTDRVAVAYDDRSGKKLWKLPDKAAGRVAPEVTAVRHGIVYGSTDNGAVALDARTGQDKATDLAIAPEYVGRGFGIAPKGESGDDQLELYLHPATD
ncbi:PQQ-binding-like beta-propeller repeat protein [Streptomyces sp. CB03238]|uniref:outer membrane protein assembly factor BamB family protein n=1 Tax=Streptomyces sp. CB03238 TaxID=1907777 RepID=UPI0015C44ED7|nr:PQQ-binding-like beta-propeller repeat protein [Streptomyces sp. CB03238]